jgi:hypothetical protein
VATHISTIENNSAKTMRQKLSTSTPMRLLAISLESADTVQSAATHSDMISPKYIISFNYNNNERAVVEADRSRGQSYEEKLKSANNSLRFMQEPIIFGGYILWGPHM